MNTSINVLCDADLRNTNTLINVVAQATTIEMIERSLETERKDEELEKEWGGIWRGWRKQMGRSTKDTRFVAKDNIETAMYVMSKGGYKNWSPYKDGRCR